jgi:hypothetical protein
VLSDGQQQDLAGRFERFAAETAGDSPLYATLASGLAAQPTALRRLAPELRGRTPDLDGHVRVASRTGLDLAPLHATDPGDARWLAACVWPENTERHVRLHGALQVARAHADLDLHCGDVVTTLPSTLASAGDGDVLPCVFHSAALAYLRREERDTVAEALATTGRARDLGWLSLEGPFLAPFVDLDPPSRPDEPYFLLGLTTWTAGDRRDELLARVHPHGRWLEWLSG